MRNGYIKFFRKFWDNPNTGNPAWISTWLYLLCHATHKPYQMRMDGDYRTLEPGQLICSARKIAGHLGVSRDRIRRILNDMIEDGMLHRERYNRQTVYTVLNWANYQHEYVTDEAGNEATRTAMNDATNKKKEDRRKNKDDRGDEDEGNKIASREMEKLNPVAREVLAEFNKRAGKRFKGEINLETIRGRLREGFTKEEMVLVIDHKVKELKGTVNEPKWLTPVCIFRKANMDRNLNWALDKDRIEEINLREEYSRVVNSDNCRAQELREKINKIVDGKLAQQGS